MFCRPCGREHRGPECPVDELGRPSPAPGLVVAPAANTAPPLGSFAGTFTANTAGVATGYVVVNFSTSQRPPDDDGLAGVPALVRR